MPEDALSGSNIDVDVKAGMVTLAGRRFRNEAARAKALSIAKGADGVKGVTDQLRIVPDTDMAKAADKAEVASKKAGRKADDGWIKSKIYAQYMADWTTVLDDSDIDVDVDKGVVSLKGHREDGRRQGQGGLDRQGHRRREERQRPAEGRRPRTSTIWRGGGGS